MGNSASVCTANIAGHIELKNMLMNKPEIEFDARFIDDGFLIVNSTHINCMDNWCKNTFKHDYLSFTYNYSNVSLNYLDVTINITQGNKVTTTLYKKPMSKHAYLHYESNHPIHLLKSLPYSQGLRIIRICSEVEDRNNELDKMFNNFKSRGYPDHVLTNCRRKLQGKLRIDQIKPKTSLLLSHLSINNPDILSLFNIKIENPSQPLCNFNKVFITIPFYKNVYNLNKIILDHIKTEGSACEDDLFKEILKNTNIVVSYKKINSLQDLCK